MKSNGMKQSSPKLRVLTRAEREKKREYWRGKKRESRARRSVQKIRRVREKDREYRKDARSAQIETNSSSQDSQLEISQGSIWTPSARRKAISRIKTKLPKSPTKFALSISSLIHNATPRKKRALEERGLHCKSSKTEALRHAATLVGAVLKKHPEMKKKIAREMLTFKKKRQVKSISTCLGIRSGSVNQTLLHDDRKRRSDATSEETVSRITEFLNKPGVSTTLPTSKRIRRDLNERKVLDQPVRDLYKTFQTEYPTEVISLSTFDRLRPKNIETTKKQHWFRCLCEVCTKLMLN